MLNPTRFVRHCSLLCVTLSCSSEPPASEGSALGTATEPTTPDTATTASGVAPAVTSPGTTATATASATMNPGPAATPPTPATPPEPSSTVPVDSSSGGSGGAIVEEPDPDPTPVAGGMGGTTSEGGSAGSAGMAGADGGGASGNGGSAEPGGTSPSAGCGSATRPDGGRVYVADESWLVFPESYDGNTPLPVLFGFHGCGSGNRGDATRTEYTDAIRNTAFESEYVVAIPISSDAGGCWNYDADIPRVRALYDELVSNHCVDTSRVFATGHSSGAYFAVALLTENHSADAEHLNLRGMAPVAASPVGNHTTPMPVLYIENPADTERNDDNAPTVVAGFREANGCAEATAPWDGAEACNSSSGGAMVDAGCIAYDGCSEPTIWCSHNDQSYGTTGHGIPCFAAQAMDAFFKGL